MCGLTGFWRLGGAKTHDTAETLSRMTDALVHRGPDDHGTFMDAPSGVALGHRRLSILDLSPEGHQPMSSASGRFIIAYNGEVYNWRALREELASGGASFRGHSDTEVLLAGFERWGVQATIQRAAGMFAFAVWDKRERLLHLGRDRVGEKPLFVGRGRGGVLLFGSELKALVAHPDFDGEIDRGALAQLLRYNNIPAPRSIYRAVRKVSPGAILTVNAAGDEREEPYWTARGAVERGLADPLRLHDADATDLLERELRRVISEQMIADVPVGAFLSGGVDSSVVVAAMQAESRIPVRTFTIGFNEKAYDEADHARAVAKHLGTDHTELYVTPDEARAIIPDLPRLYDEPFADASQLPTFLVARLARQHVTVSLSGDGGDELWGGYNRYFWGQRLLTAFRFVPVAARRLLGAALKTLPPQRWDALAQAVMFAVPPRYRIAVPGEQVHKLAGVLSYGTVEAMYSAIISNWQRSPVLGVEGGGPPMVVDEPERWPDTPTGAERMMFLDLVHYLPDNNLVKVDRAAMGVSLETRAPLIDHRLVELAWRVPLEQKLRDGQGKWLLRQVLYRSVPKSLIERPKMGFGVPVVEWLRGPLREWGEALLAPERLRREGFFDAEAIGEKWREHVSGRRSWQRLLWAVLMFQAWLEQRGGAVASAGAQAA